MGLEVAEHPIQQIAIGFVWLVCLYANANVTAAVKGCVSALMHQSCQAVVEYANQIKIFAGLLIDEVSASTIAEQ